ncbi:thioredoxin domain-containing protein [Cyanobacteria bacterium FACHB-DQ100]|uniref:DsbA family protein n=1 Tax=Leptolyngbya sp. DQ-M1 TaxID=2933920 RepID=UPI0019C7241C|nr:thioredoxin domain-containing protein [Cyanobacteria bacterium FACHB-DQ100]
MRRLKHFASWLLVSLILFGCSAPVQADSTKIDPNFEAQVLQVLQKNPQAILDSVQAYQREQQETQRKAQQSFIQELQQKPKAVIAQSPTKGAGKTVLVEFSDFQCPYCQAAAGTVREFVTKNRDRVTLVYKHLPLTSIHAQALPAAKAAWAAGQQGKFWEFHDGLFAQQQQLGEPLYANLAKSLGLDVTRFDRDRNSQAAEAAITADVQLAEKLGINGTPFFVMNGRVFSGDVEIAALEQVLSQAQ